MKAVLRLGSAEYPLDLQSPGWSSMIFPRIYICPHCCEAWAQICIPQRWDYVQHGMPCEECPPFVPHLQLIPGSLLANRSMIPWEPDIDEVLLRALPAELLSRELDLHIRAQESSHEFSTGNSTGNIKYPGPTYIPIGTFTASGS